MIMEITTTPCSLVPCDSLTEYSEVISTDHTIINQWKLQTSVDVEIQGLVSLRLEMQPDTTLRVGECCSQRRKQGVITD